jgi:putative transcriptional regulator
MVAHKNGHRGIGQIRKAGRVTEILFLYESATHTYTRLKPMADALGVSVQAASFLFRELSHRGLVESVEGAYRPTVAGIAHLHASLNEIRDDLEERLAHLNIIRRCKAEAAANIHAGDVVTLMMEDGMLKARPGKTGESIGRASHDAGTGTLVEVVELEGIVPLSPARILCIVIPLSFPHPGALRTGLASVLESEPFGLLGAEGLEAYHLLRRTTKEPITRFGVAAASREASQVGVPVIIVATDNVLPFLLHNLSERTPKPPIEIRYIVPQGPGTRPRPRKGD